MTLTPEVTILNYRAPIRLSITLSPPSEESSEIRKWRHIVMMLRCATEYHQSGSFANPNSRLHKPELRSYACLIYKQQVILLLSYLPVDKTVSAGIN